MKQKIYNKGNGWYITCTNYKDKEDKAYLNVSFTKENNIPYMDNGTGYNSKIIDILECKFTSYKNKPSGIKVFKYVECADDQAVSTYTRNDIGPDELPFY